MDSPAPESTPAAQEPSQPAKAAVPVDAPIGGEEWVAALPMLVRVSVPCLLCGQDLKGRATAASCPKCGIQVARSFSLALLHFAGAGVRKRIRAALGVMLLAPFCWILGIALAIVFEAPTRPSHMLDWMVGLALGVMLQSVVVAIGGLGLVAAPCELFFRHAKAKFARYAAPVLAVLAIAATCLAMIVIVHQRVTLREEFWDEPQVALLSFFVWAWLSCAMYQSVFLFMTALFAATGNHKKFTQAKQVDRSGWISLVLPPLTILWAALAPLELMRQSLTLRGLIARLPEAGESVKGRG